MPLAPKSSARTDKVIQAAGKLFARQGYHGTSTREIAHLAGVSENTIFRHFSLKEDLFWSTLRFHFLGISFSRDMLKEIERCESPEAVLPKIVELLEDTVNYRPELLRLIAVAFLELSPKANKFCLEHLSPVLSAINSYLKMNIKRGKIADLDSTMLTSALILTVLMHSEIYNLIEGSKPSYSTSLEARRAHTSFWLDLIAPRKPMYLSPAAQITGEYLG